MNKKRFFRGFIISVVALGLLWYFSQGSEVEQNRDLIPFPLTQKSVEVERITCKVDKDQDGISDLDDFIVGGRKEIERAPRYRSAYYRGGYPPPEEGVCTDLIWRAFAEAGYNLKDMVDQDIAEHTELYPRVEGTPDPNIDFRRVPNLAVFFSRYAHSLTTEIKPEDVENLQEWQGGDIVIYGHPLWHIALVSDKRRPDGVPYIIHNAGPIPGEDDLLLDWPSPLLYHFRFPQELE